MPDAKSEDPAIGGQGASKRRQGGRREVSLNTLQEESKIEP